MEPFTVLIDPGHGGKDPGAGEVEAKINLRIALILSDLLQCHFPVWMTRTADRATVSLTERARYEHDLRPALTVSIHCNAAENPTAHGFEVFTSIGETAADRAACCIIHEIQNAFPRRRLRYDLTDGDLDKEAEFWMLRKTIGPAVLIECGFVSHPEERDWLLQAETQRALAEAIAAGILRWRS